MHILKQWHAQVDAVNDKFTVTTTCKHCLEDFLSMGTDKKIGHVELVPGCGVAACKQTGSEIDPAELERLRPVFKKG